MVVKRKTTRAKATTTDGGQGGRRHGSGKPAWFRGKSASSADPMYAGVRSGSTLRLTGLGWQIALPKVERLTGDALDAAGDDSKAIPVSLSDYVETLIRLYGERITLNDVKRAVRMG